MEAVLEQAKQRGFAGVRLMQAAFHNRSLSLYTKLGFDVQELGESARPALELDIPGCAVRPAIEEDPREAVVGSVSGFMALIVIESCCHSTRYSDCKWEHDGRITGYATTIGFLVMLWVKPARH